MAKEKENKQPENEFEVILAIVNVGFADQAMLAAREVGAKGGTIIRARGSSNIGVDKKYGLTITPEKDNNQKGIVFTLPVESTIALKYDKYN